MSSGSAPNFRHASSMRQHIVKLIGLAANRRALLILAGVLVSVYGIAVLLYVQSIPDLGIRSVFSTTIKGDLRIHHGSVPPEVRATLGISDTLVRLSVGIEDVDDLMGDLEAALA